VKIAVFCNKKNSEAAQAIGKIVTAQDVTVVYHDTDQVWDKNYCKNPLLLLDKISHMLFIYSADTKDISSLVFFSGFCLGRGIRVLILETDARLSLPENCMHLGVFLKPESFEEYFLAEKVRFLEEDKKARARSELLARGISCFEENFVLIVTSGDADAVKLFLEAGFDPCAKDSKGVPLLSLAVRSQLPEIVQLLIDSGADVNALSGDRGYSPLMDSVQKGDRVMAELLLENGANTELKSKDGQTALIVCAGRGDGELASVLVHHGANPSATDNLGMSALTYAKLFKNEKMMELFNETPS
jgi:uncharacterized protein